MQGFAEDAKLSSSEPIVPAELGPFGQARVIADRIEGLGPPPTTAMSAAPAAPSWAPASRF
jgi:hypothetical protein